MHVLTWVCRLGVCLALLLGKVARLTAAEVLPRLHLGSCTLADSYARENFQSLPAMACVKAKAGGELLSALGFAKEGGWLGYGEAYIGLHANSFLSWHGRGEVRSVAPLHESAKDRPSGLVPAGSRQTRADYALLRVGNPVLHRYRLHAGRMRLPFGLDVSSATAFNRHLESRLFWDAPRYGVALTADNLSTTAIEIGFGSDAWLGKPARAGELREQQAASFRWSYDMSALDGSRLIVSGYQEETGRRRMGLAFVSENLQGEFGYAELVRVLASPDGKAADFLQLLRIGYRGLWREDGQWSFQFDDERFRHRQGTLTYELGLVEHLLLRLALAYSKDESGRIGNRWLLVSGMEAHL